MPYKILYKDITKMKVDVVVNSANAELIRALGREMDITMIKK